MAKNRSACFVFDFEVTRLTPKGVRLRKFKELLHTRSCRLNMFSMPYFVFVGFARVIPCGDRYSLNPCLDR